MKIKLLFSTLTMFALFLPIAIFAGPPPMPLLIYGDVLIGDTAASVSTIISAEIDGVGVATSTITEEGKYTIDVIGDEGDTVVLKVNGVIGGQTPYVDPWETPSVEKDLTTYTLTINISPADSGTVTLSPVDSDSVTSGAQYASGASVTLTAQGSGGSGFSSWSGDLTGTTNPDTIAMGSSNKTVTANTYTLTCATVSHAATYNAYPTCGAATCDSGYTESDGACVADSGGGGGGGGGGSMSITTNGSVTASKLYGGQTTVTDDSGNKAIVRLSANTVSGSTKFKITPLLGTSTAASGMVLGIASSRTMVGNHFYNFTATRSGVEVTEFDKDVRITIYYSDEDIEGLDEDTLKIYYWDEDTETWKALTSTVTKSLNKIVAYTDHFTYFSVMDSDAGTVVDDDDDVVVPISEMTTAQLRAKITEIMAQIQVLLAALAELKGEAVYAGIPAGYEFTRDMELAMVGNDVKYLQIILNSDSATQIASSGVGSSGNETTYFGSLTKAAVIKFQNKYSDDVLAPWGFTSGTGYAGRTTREKLNEMLGQ